MLAVSYGEINLIYYDVKTFIKFEFAFILDQCNALGNITETYYVLSMTYDCENYVVNQSVNQSIKTHIYSAIHVASESESHL